MNPWKGLRGLPREVWILFTATLINRAGTMALPFLVLYLTQSLGFSPGQAGLSLTVYGAGALVTGPLAGRLCDKVGAVRVVEGSLFLSGAVILLLPLARRYGGILALVFVWAILAEAFRPASMTVMTEVVQPAQRKTALAVARLAINLGLSVGPAAGGFLAMLSFPALFAVDGATSLLAGMVMAVARWRKQAAASAPAVAPPVRVPDGLDAEPVTAVRGLADRHLVYFLAAMIPIVMVFFQSQSAMALYMVRDLRMPEALYGLMFTLNTLMVILIEVPLNAAMSGWPHRRALSLGALLTAAGFGAMVFAAGPLGVAATVVVWTFGEMILLPTAATYVADISPPSRRGEYMGLFTMAFSVAFAIGPWLGTAVLERWGARLLWPAALVAGSISAAMLARVHAKGGAA